MAAIDHLKVSILRVSADRARQRLDNFLFSQLKGVPKSHVYKILRSGEVRVNKKRVQASYRLQADDEIRLPPLRVAESTTHNLTPKPEAQALLEKRILYEDDNLLVLNKPAGMAVHGGSGINFGVIETLRAARPNATLELVHRLDRDTSGCLIIAKKRSALRDLHAALREGKVSKTYQLLVRGRWHGRARLVTDKLLKNQLASGERIVRVHDVHGKESATKFIPVKVYAHTGVEASLVWAELYTGRTHQIRVHAAHIGYPVAGDDKYGDKEFNRVMREFGLTRLFLHAEKLSFPLLGSGKKVTVHAELDAKLVQVLTNLGEQ